LDFESCSFLFENCIFDATNASQRSLGGFGPATYKNCIFNGNFQKVYPGKDYLFNDSNIINCTFMDLSGTWIEPKNTLIENSYFYNMDGAGPGGQKAIGGRENTVLKNCSFFAKGTTPVILSDNAIIENSKIKDSYIELRSSLGVPVTAYAFNTTIDTTTQYSIRSNGNTENRALQMLNVAANKPVESNFTRINSVL
jgi:hypothetical protein